MMRKWRLRLSGPAALSVLALLASCGGDGGTAATASISATTAAAPATLAVSAPSAAAAATATGWTYANAPFGAGGYISGILYHPTVSGLVYARTDVGGVYRRDSANSAWVPLNDDLGRDDAQLGGILSMAVDPSDGQKLYLAAGSYAQSWGRTAAILRSSDRGATWARTELPIRLAGNGDGRGTGERLQVDPGKGSVMLLGTTQDGLYRSTDSGVTWAKVSSFSPASTTFVLFARSASAAAGTATQTVYVGVASTTGAGLYKSTDGGTTWASVAGQPTGLMPLQAALDASGSLYLTYANALGPNGATAGAVWKLQTSSGTWSDVTPQKPVSSQQFGYGGVSVDKQNPGTVLVSTLDRWGAGDDVYRSTDSGATWTGFNSRSSHAAPNNPWVAAAQGSLTGKMGHWITDVDVDPFNGDNVMYNTGYGLWESRNARTTGTVAWSFNVSGIEETVPTALVSTTTGQSSTDVAHLLASMGDAAGARWTTFSATDNAGYFTDPNVSNLSVDVAEKVPSRVVRTARTDFGGYMSNDNGVTWTRFSGSPVASGNDVGTVAVSAAATTMLWVPQNQGAYRSTDGKTWQQSSGYPIVSGQSLMPVADRAVDGFYYTYDYSTGRIFESGDGGWSFSAVLTGLPTNSGSNMVSVPGSVRRDLWIATSAGLYHVDGTASAATKLSSVQEAYVVTYGAPGSGRPYWSLYLWGKVGGVVGIYQSDDKGSTWTRINDAKTQFMFINGMAGDPRVYGRLYLATSGRGVVVASKTN